MNHRKKKNLITFVQKSQTMQKRHTDRKLYFTELANTSRDYYIPYLEQYIPLNEHTSILEVGCGEGGNLLPFAERKCHVTGVDLAGSRIQQAKVFFTEAGSEGQFFHANFLDWEPTATPAKYDIILIHDVIEHIGDKESFIRRLPHFLKENGIVFWGFPAWQMPFGGHQQIAKGFCSKIPFIHLLPKNIYRFILQTSGENAACIHELLDIKQCATSIELFERLLKKNNFAITNRTLWFINPHYKQKFNLKPRKLNRGLRSIKYIRNFFTTSCFYLVRIA